MGRCTKLLVALSIIALYGNTVPAADKAESDPRLLERMTIDCANVRLHTAVERISAETGVTIRAGKSKSDWKVRDIPVLVCARDIPLGALLQSVADATHLLLSRSRIDEVWTYRIWRDSKRERELSAFDESRKAAALAATSYDWDVLSQVKDMPEEAFAGDQKFSDNRTQLKAVSNILSELGPEVKDRVLNGETIVLGLQNAPESIKPHLMSAFEEFWKDEEKDAAQKGQEAPNPLDELLKRAYVRVNFGRQLDYPDKLSVEILLHGFMEIDYSSYEALLRKYAPELPPRPEALKPDLKLDDLSSRYTNLSLSDKDGPAFLGTKVKVAAPKDGKKPTYSDLLSGVSKAIGYSIVAEGSAARYVGRVQSISRELPTLFDTEITVQKAFEFGTGLNNMDWYLDEENKLILGRDRKWTERLKALVPEKLLLDMRDKINDGGIELDDLEPLVGLTSEQCYEWIGCCPEFPGIETLYGLAIYVSEDNFWRLYFALSPSDRAQARSGNPVSLAGFDRTWLCKVLRRYIAVQSEQTFLTGRPLPGEPPLTPSMMKIDTFADPDALPDLSIWVERRDLPKPAEAKHYYYVHVEGQNHGEPHIARILYHFFPIRPPERKPESEKQTTNQ